MSSEAIFSVKVKRKRPLETLGFGLIAAVALGVAALVVYFVIYILARGIPALNIRFLTTAENPILETIGIFPSIVNTLYIIFFSLLISVPIGVGGAVYLSEYATDRRVADAIEFAAEVLSGIPSILYGVFGYVFFCLALGMGVSLLSGSLTLSVMALPVIMRTTQEALRTVPKAYREGALGLGAGKWRIIRTILLPCSLKGVLTGMILATGRMVGESAALLLVAGGSAMYMPRGTVFNQMAASGSTLSVELYRYAYSRGDNSTAFGIAAVLIIISGALNLTVRFMAGRLGKA
ncbi:MAG: phosphate ABC transporter permease PstA [Clostridiales bacterium]|nr:phosphate ABC transporter permease PstA [Clostridiales bacterium]